jgi:photosystem II stability/assembly factor-like uncharacterized protein
MQLLRPVLSVSVVLACTAAVGCGGDAAGGTNGAAASNALVDTGGDLPLVMDLTAVPGSADELLLSTNKALFRVAGGKATPMRATVSVPPRGSSTIGRTMALSSIDDTTLIGSGHPDDTSLPTEMGVLRSDDGGKTWTSVSRLDEADLHMFQARHGRLYGWDAILGAVLVSKDQGKTFSEGITPPGPVSDMAVSPDDPATIVITGETAVFRSEDEAQTWRPLTTALDARLAWPDGGPLVRADSDGTIHHSTDAGDSWEQVGTVEDQPQDFHVGEDGALFLALADGSVVRSTDQGRSWSSILDA